MLLDSLPNAMPLKGENPITTYFPRVSLDAKLKTLIQPKPRLAKRAQSPDEIDSANKGTSRKRSKIQKHPDVGECVIPRSLPDSSQAISGQTASARGVIEIQDTPSSSLYKAALSHQSTPPSSPLPDLTPSPEVPPQTQNSLHFPSFDGVADDADPVSSCSASTEAGFPESREVSPDFIPSSQTQTIDYHLYENESPKMSQNTGFSSFSTPVRSPLEIARFQISSYIPSSHPDTTPLELLPAQEEFIPSSQSQLMNQIPTSPLIPDFDTVPSSQSQEFFYSRHIYNSQQKAPGASGQKKISLMGTTTNGAEVRARSSENGEHLISAASPGSIAQDVEEPYLPTVIPSSQTPACTSRHSSPDHEGEKAPSTQSAQYCWNNGEGSYESLPDVMKDFQDMFGDTFESLPPDFPMSLRF